MAWAACRSMAFFRERDIVSMLSLFYYCDYKNNGDIDKKKKENENENDEKKRMKQLRLPLMMRV